MNNLKQLKQEAIKELWSTEEETIEGYEKFLGRIINKAVDACEEAAISMGLPVAYGSFCNSTNH